VAGIGMIALAVYAWRKHPMPETRTLALLSFAVAEWSLVYAVELASAELSIKYLCVKIEFFGALIIPAAWLWFSLQYTNREKWLRPRNIMLLAIEPAVILALVWTNDAHGLILQEWVLNDAGPFKVLEETFGIALQFDIFYSYVLLLIGILVFLSAFIRSSQPYRGQILAILIAAAAPWLLNAIFSLGLSPFGPMHLTPFAFTISCLGLFLAMFRYRLLDIVPIARSVVIENMIRSVIVLDARDRVVDLNPASLELFGTSPADAIGKPAENLFSRWPQLASQWREESATDSDVIKVNNGDRQIFELEVSSLSDRRGYDAGNLIMLRDITTREHAQEYIRFLSSAVEQTTEGVAVVDLDGNLLFVNNSFAAAHGFAPVELIGKHLSIFHTQDQLPAVEKANQMLIENGEFSGEIWHMRRDGTTFPALMANTVLRDDDGNPIGLIGTLVDITDRKKAEEELKNTNRKLMELESLRENLVNMIVHDMKNPVTTTLLGLDLVESDPAGQLTEKQSENLHMAKRSQFKLSEMINNLLEISKLESGALKPHRVDIDISNLISRIAARYHAMASAEDIDIHVEVNPDARVIVSDLWLLDRILSNLLSNAIRHSYEGGRIILSVEQDDSATAAMISVTDFGEGIPQEHHDKIFDKFYQVELRESGDRTDTGLGLTFCRMAVETLDGTITVDSEPLKGSRFTILLNDALRRN
jgi:PAS domain S-box-containing protein